MRVCTLNFVIFFFSIRESLTVLYYFMCVSISRIGFEYFQLDRSFAGHEGCRQSILEQLILVM